MKRLIKPLVLALSFSSMLSANTMFHNQNIDDDFTKMQQLVANMMNQHFFHNGFGEVDNINYPKLNIQELNDKYILTFEVAGVEKKELKVSIKNHILTIEGERKSSKENKKDNYITQEVFFGTFKRSINLPQNINEDKLTTKYKNGILTITIPKKHITNSKTKILKIN